MKSHVASFHVPQSGPSCHSSQWHAPARKRPLFEYFLCCMSRACLGKCSDCTTTKRRNKEERLLFSYRFDRRAQSRCNHRGPARSRTLLRKRYSFLSAFPRFVPSLSWQKDHIYIEIQNYRFLTVPSRILSCGRDWLFLVGSHPRHCPGAAAAFALPKETPLFF
eukprot:COSAG06_NODE_6454_length_2925_cov_3.208776_4_plen_164_part_00